MRTLPVIEVNSDGKAGCKVDLTKVRLKVKRVDSDGLMLPSDIPKDGIDFRHKPSSFRSNEDFAENMPFASLPKY